MIRRSRISVRPNLAPRSMPADPKRSVPTGLGSPRRSRSISTSESKDSSRSRRPSGATLPRVPPANENKEPSVSPRAPVVDASKSPVRKRTLSASKSSQVPMQTESEKQPPILNVDNVQKELHVEKQEKKTAGPPVRRKTFRPAPAIRGARPVSRASVTKSNMQPSTTNEKVDVPQKESTVTLTTEEPSSANVESFESKISSLLANQEGALNNLTAVETLSNSISDDNSTARDGVDDTPASTTDTAHVVDDTPTCTADMVPEDMTPEDEVVVNVVIAPKKRRKMISAKPNLANKKFKPDRVPKTESASPMKQQPTSVTDDCSTSDKPDELIERVDATNSTPTELTPMTDTQEPVFAQPIAAQYTTESECVHPTTDKGTPDPMTLQPMRGQDTVDETPSRPTSRAASVCSVEDDCSSICSDISHTSEKGKKKRIRQASRRTVPINDLVDISKMTMRDLIYHNPVCNPMKAAAEENALKKEKKDGKKNDKESAPNSAPTSVPASPAMSPQSDRFSVRSQSLKKESSGKSSVGQSEDEDNVSNVPQVRIGPDGQIIINEASLVLDAPEPDRTIEDSELVFEKESTSSAWAYKRGPKFSQWSSMETKKFYMALSALGTDFALMTKLFRNRTRLEIKRKFKKEEKFNKDLVDKAIRDKQYFDMDFFDKLKELEVESIKELREKEKKKRLENNAKLREKRRQEKIAHIAQVKQDKEEKRSQKRKTEESKKKIVVKRSQDKGSGTKPNSGSSMTTKTAKTPRKKAKSKVQHDEESLSDDCNAEDDVVDDFSDNDYNDDMASTPSGSDTDNPPVTIQKRLRYERKAKNVFVTEEGCNDSDHDDDGVDHEYMGMSELQRQVQSAVRNKLSAKMSSSTAVNKDAQNAMLTFSYDNDNDNAETERTEPTPSSTDPSKLFPGYWSSQLAIDRTRKHTVSESLSMIDDILDAAVSDVEKAADDICNLPTHVATDADPTAMWNTEVIPQPMTSVAVEVTQAAGAALSPIAAVPSSNTQLRPTIFHKDDASRDVQSSAEEGQKFPLCSVINTPLQQPLYVKSADRNVLTPISTTDGRAMIQVIPKKIPPVNILSDQPQSFIPSTLSQVVSQEVPQENIVIAGHQNPHPVVQPIAQATQPRAHILTQAMPQPRTHIAVQPMPQPKTQVRPQVIVQPGAHSVVQPAAQLTAQTVVQPTAQLTAQTVVQPRVDPIAQTVVQLAAQTVAQPTAQLTAQTVVQPGAQLPSQTVVQPRAHPIAQTVVQPASQLTAQTVVHPAAQLTAQTVVHPAAQLTAQTVVQPGAQLPAQTLVQPIAQTVVQPTAQLTAQTVVQPGAQTVIQPRAHLTAQTMQFSGAHMAAHTMPPPDVHNDSAPFIFELNGRRYLGQPLPAQQPPVPAPSHVPQQIMSPPNVCSQSATPQSTAPVPHARQETKYRKFAKKYGHVPSSTSEANPGRKALIDAVGDVLRRNTPTERTAEPIDSQTNTSDTNVMVPKKHAGELTMTVPNVPLTDANTQPIVPTLKDYQKSNERDPIVTNSVDSNVSSSKEHYDMAYEAALGISKALSSAKSLPNTVDSSKTSEVGQCVYINADGSITTTPPEDDSDDNSDDDSPVVYIEPSLKPAQSTAGAHVVPNSSVFGMNPRSTTQSAALPQTLAHCTSHSTELTQFSPYVTQHPTPNTNAAGYMHMQMSKICPPNPTHPFIKGVAPQEMTRPIYETPYRRSSRDSLPDRPPSVQTPSVRSSSGSPVELEASEPSHIIVSVPITTDVTSQYTSAIAAHSSSVQYPNDLIGQPIQQSGLQYSIHPSIGPQVQYNNPAVTMPVIQNSPYHTSTPVSHPAVQHQAYPPSRNPTIVQYNEPHRVTHSQGTVQYRHPTPQPQPHVRYTTRVQHLVPSPVTPVHVTQSPTRYYVRPQMLSPTNTSAYRVPYSTLNVNSLLHPSEHIPTPVYLPSTRGQQVIAHSTSGLSPANATHSVTLPSPHYSSDTDIDVTSYSSPMRPKGFLAPEGITIAHPSPPKPKGDSDDSDEEEEKTEIIMNVIYD